MDTHIHLVILLHFSSMFAPLLALSPTIFSPKLLNLHTSTYPAIPPSQ